RRCDRPWPGDDDRAADDGGAVRGEADRSGRAPVGCCGAVRGGDRGDLLAGPPRIASRSSRGTRRRVVRDGTVPVSMAPNTPYSQDLGDREPLSAMKDAVESIHALTANWTLAQFERSYAPHKWTARQILVHLAQSEIALGNRARMALAIPNYTAQAFNQDDWMSAEAGGAKPGTSGASGRVALDALVAMNAFNRAFFETLTPADRATPFSHPEYGALTVDWLIHQMAGHLRHHLAHFDEIAKRQA